MKLFKNYIKKLKLKEDIIYNINDYLASKKKVKYNSKVIISLITEWLRYKFLNKKSDIIYSELEKFLKETNIDKNHFEEFYKKNNSFDEFEFKIIGNKYIVFVLNKNKFII